MGTQFLLEVSEGSNQTTQYKLIMNRLIALFALVAVAFAEPEADSQSLYSGVYNPMVYGFHGAAHATAGLVAHPSGAVTPDDTASVKAAKVQHHAAKVNEYLKKPYMYTAPVVHSGYSLPLTTYGHIFKREAESDSQYLYNYPYPYSTYRTGYGYPSV